MQIVVTELMPEVVIVETVQEDIGNFGDETGGETGTVGAETGCEMGTVGIETGWLGIDTGWLGIDTGGVIAPVIWGRVAGGVI